MNATTQKQVTAWTDLDGSYLLWVPDEGHYTVRVQMAAFAASTQDVTLDATHPDVQANFELLLLSRARQIRNEARNSGEEPQRRVSAGGSGFQSLPVAQAGDTESRLALGVLKDIVRRTSLMPGQRNVVLVSPGFLTPLMESEYMELIDRAVRSQIIISALDARGLYTILPGGDVSRFSSGNVGAQFMTLKLQYQNASAAAESDVTATLAEGTGGTFFQNNNDLDEGLRRASTAPEYYYVLGFSPQNLKLDGSFHSLKVTLKNPEKLTLQARRGYYAPRRVADASEEAKQEIEDAVFSQEELHDLPIGLHTQFSSPARPMPSSPYWLMLT